MEELMDVVTCLAELSEKKTSLFYDAYRKRMKIMRIAVAREHHLHTYEVEALSITEVAALLKGSLTKEEVAALLDRARKEGKEIYDSIVTSIEDSVKAAIDSKRGMGAPKSD
jgi:hypothetical protein